MALRWPDGAMSAERPQPDGTSVLAAMEGCRLLQRFQLAAVIGAGLILVLAGATVREGTAAFWVSSTSLTGNRFSTALVGLNSPALTPFNVSNLVPGDFRSLTGQITNGSTVSVNYFLTIWADRSSLLDSDPSGLQLVIFRCGSVGAPTACSTATTFETVTGVMNQASTQRVTTSGGPPAAAGVSVSGTNLVFTTGRGGITGGATIAGVPILTRNNPNTQGSCSVANDGACALGGYSAVTASSPATTITSGTHQITTPAISNGNGLGAAGSGREVDDLLIYVFLPSTDTGYQGLSSTVSLVFTAVQPTGQVY